MTSDKNDGLISEDFKKEIIRKEIYKLISTWSRFDTNDILRKEYIDVIFPKLLEHKGPRLDLEILTTEKIKKLIHEINLDLSFAYEVLNEASKYSPKERQTFIEIVDKKEKYTNLSNAEKERILIRQAQEKRNQMNVNFRKKVEGLLNNFFIKEAIQLFNQNPIFSNKEFADMKASVVKNWFMNNVTDEDGEMFKLDDQQALAVVEDNKNILVSARAGSGKTRVIVARIVYLVELLKEEKGSIKTFAFNKSTPIEINGRLQKIKVNGKIFTHQNFCQTFHSFASSVTRMKEQYAILENKDLYIQKIIEIKKNDDIDFSEKVYQFFRNESFKVGKSQFGNESHYYEFIKNSKYSTLDGKNVKSIAEKYISDFLFEHGIKYTYEKEFYPRKINVDLLDMTEGEKLRFKNFIKDKNSIKPDFYLNDYEIVWEHWAISGNETESEQNKITESEAIGAYDDYLKNLVWKKDFWKNWRSKIQGFDIYELAIKNIKNIIETTKSPESREIFENQLKAKLAEVGIKVIKRNHEDIVNEVWEIALKKFPKMISSFINRYQQKFSDNYKDFLIEKQKFINDERIFSFINIGETIYNNYLKSFDEKLNIINNQSYDKDYNILIKDASNILGSEKIIDLLNIKHILIDEYQDFSDLFFKFIKSIRNQNSKISLFCVGDDWQLINRFAGSDDGYFNKFNEYFENSSSLNILTNYRSDKSIVNHSNIFMSRFFNSSGAMPHNKNLGEVIKFDITKDFLNSDDDFQSDCSDLYNNNYDKARYLYRILEIIGKNKDNTFLILHRYNEFKGESLLDLKLKIKKILLKYKILDEKKISKNITIKTIHSSKGMQADVVIILEVNNGIIPMNHPDNSLYEIFGETVETNFLDQVRLFYVAITRPKTSLYLLYEEKFKSSFLKMLDLKK